MGSEYDSIPFADDIKELIDLLDEKIISLTTVIASLETDLEAYGFDFLFKQWKWIVSDDLAKSNDAEVEKNSASPVLAKITTFYPIPLHSTITSAFRIKFDLKQKTAGSRVYARIYKNGSGVGTERSTEATTWQNYSEDIGSWDPEDRIELYVWTLHTSYPVVVRNFRIYGEIEGVLYLEPTW